MNLMINSHVLCSICDCASFIIVLIFFSWGVCSAEGLKTVDKCYPCPLANGDFSTKTGLLLKDTYQPLLSALEDYVHSMNNITSGKLINNYKNLYCKHLQSLLLPIQFILRMLKKNTKIIYIINNNDKTTKSILITIIKNHQNNLY